MQQALVRIGGGKKNKELLPELRKLLEENKKQEFFKLVDNTFEGTELSHLKKIDCLHSKSMDKLPT